MISKMIANSFVKVFTRIRKELKYKYLDEKKDRIIWSIVNSGKSEYTDYENTVNRFMNEVIDAPKDEQIYIIIKNF